MDPLSGVSSVFAVVSLALQLVATAKETKSLIRRIRNAPQEFQRLQDQIEQVSSIAEGIRTVLNYQARTHGDDYPITSSSVVHGLQQCELILKSLQHVVDNSKFTTTRTRIWIRQWTSLKLASKNGHILDIERKMGHVISLLNVALTTNLMAVQLQNTTVLVGRLENQGDSTTHSSPLSSIQTSVEVSLHQQITKNYNIESGIALLPIKQAYTCRNQTRALSRDLNREVIIHPSSSQSQRVKTYKLMASFLSWCILLQISMYRGSTTYTFRTTHVMSLELEKKARSFIQNGDICGIQTLLTTGELSVHSITREYCDTLLGASYLTRNTRIGAHTELWQISVYEEQAEVCSLLLEHGSPVAKSDAVVAGTASWSSQDQGMQVFRAICSRIDLTPYPPYTLFASEATFLSPWVLDWLTFHYIDGIFPQYKAEFLGCSLIMSVYEWTDTVSLVDEETENMSARIYLKENDTLIKKLIMSGANVHKTNDSGYTALVAILGNCPIDRAEIYVEKWLELLTETGVDIEQYFLKESRICPKSFPSVCPEEGDRQARFSYDKSLNVEVEYWTDPICSLFEALEEFKHLDSTTPILRISFRQCSECIEERLDYNWPFRYALQHLHDYDAEVQQTACIGLCSQYHTLAEERFRRREVKKQTKQTKSRGTCSDPKIPGSWID